MPYWKWKPDNCRLDEVDAAKFCRVMEGRKGILFVGERASNMEGGKACFTPPPRCIEGGWSPAAPLVTTKFPASKGRRQLLRQEEMNKSAECALVPALTNNEQGQHLRIA